MLRVGDDQAAVQKKLAEHTEELQEKVCSSMLSARACMHACVIAINRRNSKRWR